MLTLAQFQQELAATEQQYQLLQFSPNRARYKFVGLLAGKEVIWDTTLKALGSEAAAQYIDVGQCEGDIAPITIGLLVSELTKPDLLKTMFMVRQYRRLQPGRHVFRGPAKTDREGI